MHLVEPEAPNMPHPVLFTKFEMDKKEELWKGKLEFEMFFHRLQFTYHLRTNFGLPSFTRGKTRYCTVMK